MLYGPGIPVLIIMIHAITETSFLDWDGQVVTVLYTAKCNFRCPFCHNWPLMEDPEKHPEMKWAEIKKFLKKHDDFLDGVCITGGEPTMEFGLEALMQEIKNMGLKVKLDTNGTRPDILKDLVKKGLVDYIAMDFKMPLDERYSKPAGLEPDVKKITESVEFIINSGIDHEFRTTIVPTIHAKDDIVEIAKYLGNKEKYALQQFNPENTWDIELRDVKPLSQEEFMEIADACEKHVGKLVIRGLKEVTEQGI